MLLKYIKYIFFLIAVPVIIISKNLNYESLLLGLD